MPASFSTSQIAHSVLPLFRSDQIKLEYWSAKGSWDSPTSPLLLWQQQEHICRGADLLPFLLVQQRTDAQLDAAEARGQSPILSCTTQTIGTLLVR